MTGRRVVITGLGIVSPVGNSVEQAWQNILAGRSGIDRITRFDASSFPTQIGGEVKEFFLPRDFGEFCIGCTQCFRKSETLCPHYEKINPLTEALDEADVLIFESPVYVYHVTGSMKAFLDHYGYRWMLHRPEESMFHKQATQ